MPLILGKNAPMPTEEFAAWGLAQFKAGQKNVTKLHYHDCDEFFFIVSGKCVMRSEGVLHTLVAGDVLVTRMGDEHEIVEIVEDTALFWLEGELRGRKRRGHLRRDRDGDPGT